MNQHETSPLDGTDLGWLLEDLTDGSNVHRGIRMIAAGFRAIAEDDALDVPGTQLLIAQLSAAAGDLNVVAAAGRLIQWLTSDANPAMNHLPADIRKTVHHQGELASHALRDTDLCTPAAQACAALDTH